MMIADSRMKSMLLFENSVTRTLLNIERRFVPPLNVEDPYSK